MSGKWIAIGATLRPCVRGERGVVGDGDGASDGQSEAVVIVDVVSAVELAESLTPLQHAAG
jgi:hypothetical protein